MANRSAQPRCPRCGYDQSGEVATWKESCPLEGVCPECGHGFEWGEVCATRYGTIPWLPEHARTRRGVVLRSITVLPRLLRPSRFWRQVGVTPPIRVGRLAVFVLLALIVPHMLMAMGSLFDDVVLLSAGGYSRSDRAQIWQTVTWACMLPGYRDPTGFAVQQIEFVWVAVLLLMHLLVFASMSLLPHTRRLAKLRVGHVFRAFAYGLIWLVAVQTFGVVFAFAGSLAWIELDYYGTRPWWWYSPLADLYRSPWLMLVSVAWIAWWWRSAIVRGWRVEQGNLVWILLMTLSLLGSGVLASIAWGVALELAGQ